MQFQPVHQGAPFTVPVGASVPLGRQPRFKLTNIRISRQHAELTVHQQGSSITCTCLAHKKVEVQRGAEFHTVQSREQYQLLPGDILYLVREGTQLSAGFRLTLANSSSSSGASLGPQSKRKSDATAPSSASKRCKSSAKPTAAAAAPAAAAAGDQHQEVHGQQQQQRVLQPATVAAAPTDSLSVTLHNQCATGSGGSAEQLQIFAGVRLCVWDPHHTQRAAQLAANAGAELQQAVDVSTTHVIAPFGLSLEQLQQHLQTHTNKQHQQHQQQAHARAAAAAAHAAPISTAVAAAAAAAAAESPVVSTGGEHSRASQVSVRRLQFEDHTKSEQCVNKSLEHTAGQQQQQQRQQQQSVIVATLLPTGVKFVTARWLTDSLTAAKLLPEDPYYIHLQRCQHHPPCTEVATEQVTAATAAGLQPAGQHTAAAADNDDDTADGALMAAAAAAGPADRANAAAAATATDSGAFADRADTAAAAAADQLVLPDSEEQWGQQVVRSPSIQLQQHQSQQQQRLHTNSDHAELSKVHLTLRLSHEDDEPRQQDSRRGSSRLGSNAARAEPAYPQQKQQQRRNEEQQQQAGDTTPVHSQVTGKHPQQAELPLTAAARYTQQQQQYRNLVLPLPDQICRPGEPWGTDGRWFEPWNDAAAADAVEQLMAHWHSYDYKREQVKPSSTIPAGAGTAAAAAAAAGTAAAAGIDRTGSASDGEAGHEVLSSDTDTVAGARGATLQQREVHATPSSAAAAVPSSNTVCEHMACSKQSFCFVKEMDRVRGTYSKGRRDEFRIRAVERAMRALELLPTAISSHEDIQAMRLGPKTTEKLQELLNTGHVWRTEVLEGSEYNKIMALFNSVWGVAESTAERWYQAGCRSLADVQSKVPNLTAMQQVGLKYYEDFLQRIPRAEVAECEAVVTEATAATLQELTGKPHSDVLQLLHCRALGSYVRGKPDCGDVDFIISPGPAASGVGLGPLMAGLLSRLAEQGYVTQDMLPLEPRKAVRGPADRVSWMGVYRGPASPCYRRLDIKLYPRCQLPTAVNYFASGQAMCRALRHWCNRPNAATSALAAALNPAGNAFRLSDRELVVIHKAFTGKARNLEQGGAEHSTAAAAAAAGSDSESGEGDASGKRHPGMHVTTSVKQGNSRMALRGKSTTIRETVVGPALECGCERDIFRALGLAYVPMHMRNLLSG